MDFALTPNLIELRERARRYVLDVLQPYEEPFEREHGVLPKAVGDAFRKAAIEANLHGGSLPKSVGGQGWSVIEQVLVHEQLGQATGGLWSYIPGAYNVLVHADAEQRTRYLDPSIRGRAHRQLRDHRGRCRAPTPGRCAATAVRDAATGEYVLNGEKWFVTGPDDTDFMIFHCDRGRRRATACRRSSWSTTTRPACAISHDPDYTHTFADRHPQFVLDDVRVPAARSSAGWARRTS